MPPAIEHHEALLHGRRIAWLEVPAATKEAEAANPIVLLHGITMSPERWGPVLAPLSQHGRVIAPALPGHGRSSMARGDYSVPGLALAVRDLLLLLGVERATVIGHSLGGGVAMQLGYVLPDLVGRQVLVCAGGLGKSLSIYLRLVTLPGMDLAMPIAINRYTRRAFAGAASASQLVGAHAAAEVFDGLARLAHPPARRAFHAILGTNVGPEGQRVTARNKLALASDLPTMIVWGARDAIIPVHHAHRAHESLPGSRLEVFAKGGHFPYLDDPDRFVGLVANFLATTEPSTASLSDYPMQLRVQFEEDEAVAAAASAARRGLHAVS